MPRCWLDDLDSKEFKLPKSNHRQHEPNLAYSPRSPMHGMETLTSFICANQYGDYRTFGTIHSSQLWVQSTVTAIIREGNEGTLPTEI
ncbi:hypothetical protein QYF61_027693 [Mycteria americana]|uniref:Uncharacterized protein n=1 Tax=Mycteria americana TaxID=33587 RepID=A0AAN7MZ63_MYCAM|nr:hypothetical protein QYF61_027684 [Mycteria americana]KAK4806692.1 hypothetical protein QYF61_027693 [Mycteria americana]